MNVTFRPRRHGAQVAPPCDEFSPWKPVQRGSGRKTCFRTYALNLSERKVAVNRGLFCIGSMHQKSPFESSL